ncbi:radical SAM protein [bacterium]|nr:radical SAM protein [bacterium]
MTLPEPLQRAWSTLIAHPWWRRVVTSETYTDAREFLSLPPWQGYELTLRRLLNLYLVRWQIGRGSTRLRGNPIKLTVEATNICNLKCPACFTGSGQEGRARSHMSLDLYRRLLDELGPTLFELEFYNWGEPLLARHIYTMIGEAHQRGISTTVSTNFSIPFDAEKAERLVQSGLTVLGVSIDGARQETYEQYRVKGDLSLVLHNCRLVRDAKRRLSSQWPRMIWEFHVFPHNTGDIEAARQMAAELDMEIAVDKGWVIGPEWDTEGAFRYFLEAQPRRCPFLWGFAVVNNDGGVSPCCGTFYREDDRGRLAAKPGDGGAASFREVWNGERFTAARRFFRRREGSPAEREDVCFGCPVTVNWERFEAHTRAGGSKATFRPDFTANDCANYFWERRPARPEGRSPKVVPLPVAAAADDGERAVR